MLELVNLNPHLYSANLYTGINSENESQITCVIKTGWQFDQDGTLTLCKKMPDIEETDRYSQEPGKSSLLAASEIMPFKEYSELMLYGTVYPINDKMTSTKVGIKIEWVDKSIWQKTLTIFGQRFWETSLFGYKISKPLPLKPLRLQYEFAYGGDKYTLNPIGLGFINKGQKIHNFPLPQIEIEPYIAKTNDQPVPAGFGPLLPHWSKNKSEAIVLSNRAPVDQRFQQKFNGGEKIVLNSFIRDQQQTITLHTPRNKPTLKLFLKGQSQVVSPECDTIIINSDDKIFCMIWRVTIKCDSDENDDSILLLS